MQKVKHLFLDALKGENHARPPVWLMRQAGRALPPYRALRASHSLRTLFFTPELIAQATLLPVDLLGVDAAILFSDIAVIALSLGLQLDYREGPVVKPYATPWDVQRLGCSLEPLFPILEGIRLLKNTLSVPLIGFCGGPFTIATYLVEGGVEGAKKWAYRSPETFQAFLDKIFAAAHSFLVLQVAEGVDTVQIFDSWANVLSRRHFQRFCLPYYRKIAETIQVPSILFMRELSLYLDLLREIPCALSLDWQSSLPEMRKQTNQTLQGNLDPDLLFAPLAAIEQEAAALRESMRGDLAFIAGLGHGVKPDSPFEALQTLVRVLQET